MSERATSRKFGRRLATPAMGEEIVISGISGRFPLSDNMTDFRENLFNKIDMVTSEKRWDLYHPDIPDRIGKVNLIEKFDAGFFGVHGHEAEIMEPMYRSLMERVVEAIFDAGVNPKELEGTNTGVYVSTINSDCQGEMMRHDLKQNCQAITGLVRCVLPNRISYILKLNGPSCIVDTACSSSLFALNEAYEDMRSGKVDAAIIGTSVLNLHPVTTLQFARLGVLSPDGASKAFDDSANGYARAETIAAIFLQKASAARRVYSKLVHCKVNCDGFKDRGITFPSADEQQNLLQEFYEECQVNPNIIDYLEAHGTGTSVGDFEEIRPIGEIFCKDRTGVLALGSVKSNMGHSEPGAGLCQIAKTVITMETGLIPPNLHFKKPREGVEAFKKQRVKVVAETTPFPGKTGLIAVSSFGFGGANGHALLKWNETAKINGGAPEDDVPRLVCVSGRTKESVEAIFEKIQPLDVEFVGLLHQLFKCDIPLHHYRGFAIVSKSKKIFESVSRTCVSKPGFCLTFGDPDELFITHAAELLDLSIARNVFQRVEKVLANEGFSVINKEKLPVDELSTVLITVTVQIAFFEILKVLNVAPKVVKGVSFGQFVEAYAKGYLSLEETISTVYRVAFDPEFHSNYHKQLELNHYNKTKKYEDVFIVTKKRNKEKIAGITLEILNTHEQIQLPQQNQENFLVSLLKIIGKLYESGYNPQVEEIYPKISFPVSRGTEMISPLIRWNHNEDWYVVSFCQGSKGVGPCERTIGVNVKQSDWNFIVGHVIDGRNLFPATGYLYIVWQVFASMRGKLAVDTEVVFEDVRFDRATNIPRDGKVEFLVSIRRGSGCFEVVESDASVVSGRIDLQDKLKQGQYNKIIQSDWNDVIQQQERDVYKELRLRGYNYSGLFKSIKECDLDCGRAMVQWHKNWIAFMDNMLQLQILNVTSRELFVPTYIKRMTIDASYHLKFAARLESCPLPVYYYKELNTLKCGGIEIRGLNASSIARKKSLAGPVLEKYVFVPNEASLTLEDSIRVNIQIILENSYRIKIKFAEIQEEALTPLILEAFADQPLIQAEALLIQDSNKTKIADCLLVVGANLLQNPDLLEQAFRITSQKGFVISKEHLTNTLHEEFAEILTVHKTPAERLILLRKHRTYKPPKPVELGSVNWIENLQNLMKVDQEILVYSQNEPESGILGFVNCLRREPGGEVCKCAFVQDDTAPKFDLNLEFYKKQFGKNFAINVFKNGQWGTYRHLLLQENLSSDNRHVYVQNLTKGDLSSLKWIEGPLTEKERFADVHYSSLNFKDVMTATGRIQFSISSSVPEEDFLQGFEFSGRDSSGKRVMGVLSGGSLANRVIPDEDLTLPVPDEWSLEQAATVPVVYLTVLYALIEKARIKRGQSILIHSGAGGIGQAAINVAHHYDLEIYVTVGAKEKRKFLLDNFPCIQQQRIGNSRDTTFEQLILKETEGKGVDLILNSLAEEKLQASLRCLAKGGSFLEIGKFDLLSENRLHLQLFNREASFHGIHIDRMMHAESHTKKQLMNLLKTAIQAGAVKPLPTIIFGVDEVEEAFRFMASGVHIGKVLIKVKEEDVSLPAAIGRYYCDVEGCCVITGGLGGFGLELIDWLVKRGARKFVVSSRNGVKNGYQASRIRAWENLGVEIRISKSDISKRSGCKEILEEANSLGTVRSIFHLAVVLLDALFENQTAENFSKAFAPKADAAKHLDTLSREFCPHLKDFVVFSSVSCGRGNAGQTNYGMANSIMERICEERKKLGFPGLAIQWGAVGDVGLVAEMQTEDTLLEIGGTLQQRISSCLQVLDRLLKEKEAAVVASMVVAEKRSASGRADNIVDAVANIIGVRDIKTVSLHSSLPELGMDSMMATEIKQTMEREFEIFLTVKDVRNLTFAKLHEIMSAKATAELQVTEHVTMQNDDYANFVESLGRREDADKVVLRLESSVGADEEAPTIFLFPGMEGVATPLGVLTKNLAFHCFCFQFCSEAFKEAGAPDIAAKILDLMEEKLFKLNTFGFVGHSFGCLVALEMASLLEKRGVSGKVILVDGAPKSTVNLAKQQAGDRNEDGVQLKIIESLVSNYLPSKKVEDLLEELAEQPTRADRESFFFSHLPLPAGENQDYYKNLLRKGQERMKALLSYRPTYSKITSKLVLCKPTERSVAADDEDYGLCEFAEDVKIRYFTGNHFSMLKNVDLCKFIAEELC